MKPANRAQDLLYAAPEFQPILRRFGLDAAAVFEDARIVVWRSLADRQNCTLDEPAAADGRMRLHIKRYVPTAAAITPAAEEVAGHRLLVDEGIATAALVGWGEMADGRSFTIWLDLEGFTPGDKLVASGFAFERLLLPTAELAARLHKNGLHHRDLYLCHFMVKSLDTGAPELKLIDTARVRRLPGFLTRRRWIIKDLAQFWYSTTKLEVSEEQRRRWLAQYAQVRGDVSAESLRPSIERKVRSIARHDVRLNRKEPTRNVSISQA